MKLLFVSGDDYCALTFERHFKGRKVSDVIENLENCEKEFLEANTEYEDSLR